MTFDNELLVYIGTYTGGTAGGAASKGIYRAAQSVGRSARQAIGGAVLDNPSFAAISRTPKDFCTRCPKVGVRRAGGEPTGFVRAYAIGVDGGLAPLNRVESAGAVPVTSTSRATGFCQYRVLASPEAASLSSDDFPTAHSASRSRSATIGHSPRRSPKDLAPRALSRLLTRRHAPLHAISAPIASSSITSAWMTSTCARQSRSNRARTSASRAASVRPLRVRDQRAVEHRGRILVER